MKGHLSSAITRRLIITLAVIVVGVLASTATLDRFISHTIAGRFDERGSEYFTETLKRAAYTYAVARGINGVISVIQDTEIAVSPAGIGLTLAVGEILDPVNDLIERFSWVMLVSTASLGIQKILMEVGSWIGLKFLLSLSMLCVLGALWTGRSLGRGFLNVGFKLLLAALVIRFCIPAVALTSDKVYRVFLEPTYLESTRLLRDVGEQIKDPAATGKDNGRGKPAGGFWAELKHLYDTTMESTDMERRLGIVKDKVSHAVTYVIDLIVVFTLQTVLIPLLVLWGLVKFTGYLFGKNLSGPVGERVLAVAGIAAPARSEPA